MNAPPQIRDLVAEVVHAYPSAQMELDPLPSGVCFLWVTLRGRNFVIEYHPVHGTAVSENKPATPPFVGHDRVFSTVEDAARHFRQLLFEAARETNAQLEPEAALREAGPQPR